MNLYDQVVFLGKTPDFSRADYYIFISKSITHENNYSPSFSALLQM